MAQIIRRRWRLLTPFFVYQKKLTPFESFGWVSLVYQEDPLFRFGTVKLPRLAVLRDGHIGDQLRPSFYLDHIPALPREKRAALSLGQLHDACEVLTDAHREGTRRLALARAGELEVHEEEVAAVLLHLDLVLVE